MMEQKNPANNCSSSTTLIGHYTVHTHPAEVCGEMINFDKVLSGCSFGCSKAISLIRSVRTRIEKLIESLF